VPHNPLVRLPIGLGVTELSVSPSLIAEVKQAVRRLELKLAV
jgi:phosphoenolpyruvate-protein kinase (PTS system EI component)